MSKTPLTTLVHVLSVIALVASLSACNREKKKLPVCPGDPRCEKLLY